MIVGGVNATHPETHEARGGTKDAHQPATSFNAGADGDTPSSPSPCAADTTSPLCGITRNTGRIEWVCVRPVHDTGSKNRGRQVTGYYPQSGRHYFVRKYPGRNP